MSDRILNEVHCDGSCICLHCLGFPGFTEVQWEGHIGSGLHAKGMHDLWASAPLLPRALRPQVTPWQVHSTQVYLDGHALIDTPTLPDAEEALGLLVTEVWCSRPTPGLDGVDPLANDGWVIVMRDHGHRKVKKCLRCREGLCQAMLTGAVSVRSERPPDSAVDDLLRPGVTPTHVVR